VRGGGEGDSGSQAAGTRRNLRAGGRQGSEDLPRLRESLTKGGGGSWAEFWKKLGDQGGRQLSGGGRGEESDEIRARESLSEGIQTMGGRKYGGRRVNGYTGTFRSSLKKVNKSEPISRQEKEAQSPRRESLIPIMGRHP